MDLRKEITLLTIVSILGISLAILVYFFTRNLLFLGTGICLAFVLITLFFKKYDILEERRRINLELEFIEVFSYLRIYLSNSENVYRALLQASEYTSNEMKNEISKFIKSIDNDKTIMPFIEFSKLFKNKVIEEVMISLYQMIDGGFTGYYLTQFISLFDNFKSRYLNEDLTKRYKKMDLFTTFSLFGGAYIMFIILILIINVIGGVISGF